MYCIWIPDERAVEYSLGAIFFSLFFYRTEKAKNKQPFMWPNAWNAITSEL